MRGHIEKKDKNWYVILELDKESGKRDRRTISVKKELGLNRRATKPEADTLLIKKLRELQQGFYFDPENITTGDYLDQWMRDYGETNLDLNTYDSYESFIRLHIKPEIGNIPLQKLKPTHIQGMYSKKLKSGRADNKKGGLSARSVRYIHMILKESLSQAVKWEIVQRNVVDAVTPPKEVRSQATVWTPEDANSFLEYVKEHRLYPLYFLAIYTGLRRGEVLGLRWIDVDLVNRKISISQTIIATKRGTEVETTKNKSSTRTVAISPQVVEVFKKHRQRQRDEALCLNMPNITKELVFTSQKGTPLNPRNLVRHFKCAINKAKLPPITFHDLRYPNLNKIQTFFKGA